MVSSSDFNGSLCCVVVVLSCLSSLFGSVL